MINWNNPITRGLIFDSPFNEGGGSNARDVSGRNIGVLSGSTKPAWVNTVVGHALSFDGANAYIDFPETSILDLTGSGLTIECLFICTNTTAGGDMVNKPHVTGAHTSPFFAYSMHVTPSGIRTWITTSGNSGGVSTTEVAISQNKVVHGIGTYDGSNIIQYVNGIRKASTGASGTLTNFNTPLRIGANGAPGEFFPGTIFYARVWNRALLPIEVKLLYSNPWQVYIEPSAPQSFPAPTVVAGQTISNWIKMQGVGQA